VLRLDQHVFITEFLGNGLIAQIVEVVVRSVVMISHVRGAS